MENIPLGRSFQAKKLSKWKISVSTTHYNNCAHRGQKCRISSIRATKALKQQFNRTIT